MLWEVIENYLADCITTELKKRPLGTRTWKDDYQPEGFMVLDGTSWDFFLVFEGGKAVASKGSNVWPDGFEELYKDVMVMLGVERER